MQQLLGAVHGNPDAMNGFVRVISGVVSPAEFFSKENVGRIFAATATRQGGEGGTILGPAAPERREVLR